MRVIIGGRFLTRISCGRQGLVTAGSIDCGIAVNPERATAQVERRAKWVRSAAPFGRFDLHQGRGMKTNLGTVHLLTDRETPDIRSIIPVGASEPVVVPAVAPEPGQRR